MNKPPRSAYDKVCGMLYFPRMLDKIRLFAGGELRPDFHANLGKGADGRCADFLRVDFAALKDRAALAAAIARQSASDETSALTTSVWKKQ